MTIPTWVAVLLAPFVGVGGYVFVVLGFIGWNGLLDWTRQRRWERERQLKKLRESADDHAK